MSSFQREREALGLRLRELRREARLTGRQLAESLAWHPSKISKIEAGRQTPSTSDLDAWVVGCRCESAHAELAAALRSLDSHYLEYRRALRPGLTRLQREFADIEANASFIRNFESALIPGLLQTPDYARRRLEEGTIRYGAKDLDEAVAARMERQQILYRSDKRFHFVVTEAALRYRLCSPDVMTGQLDRMISLTAMHGLRLGVIPFDTEYGLAPLSGFFVFDDRLVRVETPTARLSIEEPQEVEAYLRYFAEYAELAVYGGEARALITQIMTELAASLEDRNNASNPEQ